MAALYPQPDCQPGKPVQLYVHRVEIQRSAAQRDCESWHQWAPTYYADGSMQLQSYALAHLPITLMIGLPDTIQTWAVSIEA